MLYIVEIDDMPPVIIEADSMGQAMMVYERDWSKLPPQSDLKIVLARGGSFQPKEQPARQKSPLGPAATELLENVEKLRSLLLNAEFGLQSWHAAVQSLAKKIGEF